MTYKYFDRIDIQVEILPVDVDELAPRHLGQKFLRQVADKS